MDFSHYSGLPVRMAVALVNTYHVTTGEDELKAPGDLVRLTAEHGGDWFDPGWKPGEEDLHQVREIRTRLRDVFQAGNEADAARVLNQLLADVNAVPRISVHGPGPHLHFESEQSAPARYLGAVVAMGLSVALIEGGFERFGICQSSSCGDVFVDTSRNRSRLHCSETCTTREAVAAHRARQREKV